MADTWKPNQVTKSYYATLGKLDIDNAVTQLQKTVKELPDINEVINKLPLDQVAKDIQKAQSGIEKHLTKATQALSSGDKFTKMQSQFKAALDNLGEDGDLVKNISFEKLGPEINNALSGLSKDLGDLGNVLKGDLSKFSNALNAININGIKGTEILKNVPGITTDMISGVESLMQKGAINLTAANIASIKSPEDLNKLINVRELEKNFKEAGNLLSNVDTSIIKKAFDNGKLIDIVGTLGKSDAVNKLTGALETQLGKTTKALSNIDVSQFKGGLGIQLGNLKDSLDGLADSLRGDFSSLTKDMGNILENIAKDNILGIVNADDLNALRKSVESAGSDFPKLLSELEKAGHIVRGKTVSGFRTVPSAIQSVANTTPGVRSSDVRPSVSASQTATTGSGSQPGRLEGTRVSFANRDPRQVPRQDIVDALDQMCKTLDIYVQITPQGGWTGRSTGTRNHPTGWAADFQVLKEGGGLILPKEDPVLYGKIGAELKKIGNSKNKCPGIGEYPSFMHYDEYPPRTSSHWPNLKVVHWGSGWNMRYHIAQAESSGNVA